MVIDPIRFELFDDGYVRVEYPVTPRLAIDQNASVVRLRVAGPIDILCPAYADTVTW